MIAASPNESHDARAKRMIAALVAGADLEAIAAQERLPAKEAQAILREGLGPLGRAGCYVFFNPSRPAIIASTTRFGRLANRNVWIGFGATV